MKIYTYSHIKKELVNRPTREMVKLHNGLLMISMCHNDFINDPKPFEIILNKNKGFCIAAQRITGKYTAVVLGKHTSVNFPENIMRIFFNISSDYNLQYSKIKGEGIDGCLFVIHQEKVNFDLKSIYKKIYD